MELERPGEEKKKRWEAKMVAKSGGDSESTESSEVDKKSSVVAVSGLEVETEVRSYMELKFLMKIDEVEETDDDDDDDDISCLEGGEVGKVIGKHFNFEKQRLKFFLIMLDIFSCYTYSISSEMEEKLRCIYRCALEEMTA